MRWRNITYAIVIYSCTLPNISPYVYLILLFPVFYNNKMHVKFSRDEVFIIGVIFLALINKMIGILEAPDIVLNAFTIIPYFIFTLMTVALAKLLDYRVYIYIFYLILFEIAIGILQHYVFEVRTFYDSSKLIGNSELLYNNRVFGLTGNSSGFAFKIFFASLIYYKYSSKITLNRYLFIGLITIGLLITFNRTVIISMIIFLILFYINKYRKKIFSFRYIFTCLILMLALLYTFKNHGDYIIEQFMRGEEDIEKNARAYSERDLIYSFFWDKFSSEILAGNNSFKYYYTTSDGRVLHPHNSYLHLFSTNGIIIGFLFMAFILYNINSKNYVFVLPILFTGLLQTSIFWGASFNDLIFYHFLLSYKSSNFLKTKFK